MFGAALTIPVPDVDRTDYLLMLGANPFASNGSLMTAPDIPGRLRALRARGGKLVVVDPRRTKTAEEADEHLADPARHRRALPVRARARAVRRRTSSTSAPSPTHVERPRRGARARAPSSRPSRSRRVVRHRRRRRSAASRASSPARRRAAVYGRIGTCTQEFGTLASWLVDVLNVLTGNLDRPGGAMFTHARDRRRATPAAPAGKGRGVRFGRRSSPGARPARVLRRAPGRVPRRGDRDARRRPDPRARHDRRQPGRLDARLGPPRPGARVARLHGERRHLPSTRRRATPT